VILGKHKYKNILNAGWPWNPSPESCVFIYNYQSNGDPSNRAYIVILANRRMESANVVDNWREYIASDVDVPPRHFRDPYPTPTWALRPSHLFDLALTLPDSLPRTPEPSPEPPSGVAEDVKPEPSYSCKSHMFHSSSLLPRDHMTDNTTAKVTSSGSYSVKVEPSSLSNSSITAGEPCKEYFPYNCQS
jgi:hypothetical protein